MEGTILSVHGTFEKCNFTTLTTIAQDTTSSDTESNFEKCTFDTASVTVSRDNCTIEKCTMAAGTFTVGAAADKTILLANRTLTAIVDSGTNTELINNILI